MNFKSKDSFICNNGKTIKMFHRNEYDFNYFITGLRATIDEKDYIIMGNAWAEGFNTDGSFYVWVKEI